MSTPTPDEPTFTYERYGFSFKVYRNRVEVAERQFFGNMKPTTILLRSVTGVEATSAKIIIRTSDGKKYEYILGTKTEAGRQALVALL